MRRVSRETVPLAFSRVVVRRGCVHFFLRLGQLPERSTLDASLLGDHFSLEVGDGLDGLVGSALTS